MAYIGQDFGAGNAYAITGVVFTSGRTCGRRVAVQYADAPTGPWTTAVSSNSFPLTTYTPMYIAVPSAAGSHRCWRVLITGGLVGANPDASEIQFQVAGSLATVSNAAQAIVSSDRVRLLGGQRL